MVAYDCGQAEREAAGEEGSQVRAARQGRYPERILDVVSQNLARKSGKQKKVDLEGTNLRIYCKQRGYALKDAKNEPKMSLFLV